ncbi:MAG: hypothetical protein Tsb009_05310 [Planctomycetaceae bacterium]
MSDSSSRSRLLGITVLGDFILSEGVDAVLANLKRVGATAVATNPTVTAPAEEGEGSFQPPIDAGSSPRLFDRPLFGKHSLWVKSAVSYIPRTEFYADSSYSPRKPNSLTEQHGHIIGEFITKAKDAGLQVYLQVGAVQPSGLRDEDRPRLPNGTIPPNRMADTGSLASEAIRKYNEAYVRDLFTQYPQIDGFRPDWPEYPCYTFGEVFQDFSSHVEQWAEDREFDFAHLKSDMADVLAFLNGHLTDEHIASLTEQKPLDDLRRRFPVIDDWLRMKAALSVDCLQHWREMINEHGGPEKQLSANAFMPRYSDITGFDFAQAAKICDAVSPKLYTMHWSQMINFWGEPLLRENPRLSESILVPALARLMEISTPETTASSLDDYGYPAPDEPHPIPDEPQRTKIEDVVKQVNGQSQVTALVHGYGPPADFARRLQLVVESPSDGIWINRYGYLGEEKLDAIARIC